MSENWKIQVSPKLPDGTLINLRADTPEEAVTVLDWAIANAAKIGEAVKAVAGVAVVGAAFPGAQVSVEQAPAAPAPAPAQGGWNTSAATPPPAFGQQPQEYYAQAATAQAPAPQQAAPAAPAGPAQFCAHGAMQLRHAKPGAARQWSAWMCPTPKGTPGQCKPVDAKTGKSWD